MKKIGITIGIIAVIALIVWLVPLKTVAYTVMVDYEDIETYYVDEPYEVTETYTKDVPLNFEAESYIETDIIEQHSQVIIGGIVFQDEIIEVPIEIACVKVRNTDDIAGDFVVSFSGFEPMFGEHSLTTTLNLYAGQQETAECPADSIDNWNYEVTPGTKGVEREREVTKYEQVEKQRTVIRQREEIRYKKVTALDYLLHY